MNYNAIALMIGFGFAWSCINNNMVVRIIAIILTILLVIVDVVTYGGDKLLEVKRKNKKKQTIKKGIANKPSE